jgi:hypothetical protein
VFQIYKDSDLFRVVKDIKVANVSIFGLQADWFFQTDMLFGDDTQNQDHPTQLNLSWHIGWKGSC